MSSSKQRTSPPQFTAQYGKWKAFYNKLKINRINFGTPGDRLFDLEPLEQFAPPPRPVREPEEPERIYCLRVEEWLMEKKALIDSKRRHDDDASALTQYLSLSFSEVAWMDVQQDPAAFDAAYAARNYRAMFAILKSHCTRTATSQTSSSHISMINTLTQATAGGYNQYLLIFMEAKEELDSTPDKLSDVMLKEAFAAHIDQGMFKSQLTIYKDGGREQTFAQLKAACDKKYRYNDHDAVALLEAESKKGQIAGSTKAYFFDASKTENSSVNSQDSRYAKPSRSFDKSKNSEHSKSKGSRNSGPDVSLSRYPATKGVKCDDKKCKFYGQIHTSPSHSYQVCFLCKEAGHVRSQCPTNISNSSESRASTQNKDSFHKSKPSRNSNSSTKYKSKNVSFKASYLQCSEPEYDDEDVEPLNWSSCRHIVSDIPSVAEQADAPSVVAHIQPQPTPSVAMQADALSAVAPITRSHTPYVVCQISQLNPNLTPSRYNLRNRNQFAAVSSYDAEAQALDQSLRAIARSSKAFRVEHAEYNEAFNLSHSSSSAIDTVSTEFDDNESEIDIFNDVPHVSRVTPNNTSIPLPVAISYQFNPDANSRHSLTPAHSGIPLMEVRTQSGVQLGGQTHQVAPDDHNAITIDELPIDGTPLIASSARLSNFPRPVIQDFDHFVNPANRSLPRPIHEPSFEGILNAFDEYCSRCPPGATVEMKLSAERKREDITVPPRLFRADLRRIDIEIKSTTPVQKPIYTLNEIRRADKMFKEYSRTRNNSSHTSIGCNCQQCTYLRIKIRQGFNLPFSINNMCVKRCISTWNAQQADEYLDHACSLINRDLGHFADDCPHDDPPSCNKVHLETSLAKDRRLHRENNGTFPTDDHIYAYMLRTAKPDSPNASSNASTATIPTNDITYIIDTGCIGSSAVSDPRSFLSFIASPCAVDDAHGNTVEGAGYGMIPFAGNAVLNTSLIQNLINSERIHAINDTMGVEINRCFSFVRKKDGLVILTAPFIRKIGYQCHHYDLLLAQSLLELPLNPTISVFRQLNIQMKKPIFNPFVQLAAIMEVNNINVSDILLMLNKTERSRQSPRRRKRSNRASVRMVQSSSLIPSSPNFQQHREFKERRELNLPVQRTWTPHQRSRMLEALRTGKNFGFVSEDALVDLVDYGDLKNCNITGRDVRNAFIEYGPSHVHKSANSNATPAKPSTDEPPSRPGQHIVMDPKRFPEPTIGGGNEAFISCDKATNYIAIIIEPSKDISCVKDAESQIVAHYNQFQHRVERFTTDHEATLVKSKTHLSSMGIVFDPTAPGRHQTQCERVIQTLLKKMDTIRASLTFIVPNKLLGELMMHCANLLNSTPNVKTTPHSPAYIVEHRRPVVPRYAWGTPALFHFVRKDKHTRVDSGIIVGYDDPDCHRVRVYVFLSNRIVVRLTPHLVLPDILSEWGLTPVYKNRPNLIDSRRAAEDGAPMPSNTNFSVQGEPPISSLSPISTLIAPNPNDIPTLIVPDDAAIDLRDYYAPAINSNAHGALTTHEASTFLSPSPPEGVTINISTNTIAAAESHTDTYADMPTMVPLGKSLPNPPPALRRQSARQQEGAPRNFSQFRYADPTSTRAQINYANSTESIDYEVPDVTLLAHRLSVKKGLESNKRPQVHAAITDELNNMLLIHKSLQAIHFSDIPSEHRERVMILHMFLKEKFTPAGDFIKMKARLVMGGDKQHPDSYSDLASPTVNPLTLMTIINIIAIEDSECATFDVPAAFLVPPMHESEHFYGVLDPLCSSIAIEIQPSLAKYLTSNGRIYFRLRKYLYGLKQASIKFYSYLVDYYVSIGFTQSTLDPCLFIKRYPDGLVIVVFHVDDMLLACPGKALLNKYADRLLLDLNVEQHFESPFSFIGMTMTRDRPNRMIKLTMGAITDRLIDQYARDLTIAVTPSTQSLIDVPTTGPGSITLTDTKQHEFVSIVMTLLFVARFTRLDVLFSVIVLATRLRKATISDHKEAIRVIRYFKGTRNVGPEFDGKIKLLLTLYVDASHWLLQLRGVAGLLATLGSAPILGKCWFLKFITLSSTESEVCALTECITYILWLRALLAFLGHTQVNPTVVYQDNEAAIRIQNAGTGTFKRSKHLIAKHYFITQHIADGSIVLKKIHTSDMVVDMLTKVLSGPQLRANMSGAHITDISSE